MIKTKNLPNNEQLAQYLDQELPLLQFDDNDLLMTELMELLSFDIEPLPKIDIVLLDIEVEPLPDLDIDLIDLEIEPLMDIGGMDEQ